MFLRFGASLVNLGLLDSDGYEDFAVGAPFDGPNKEGAIYIYRGSSNFGFEGEMAKGQFHLNNPMTLNKNVLAHRVWHNQFHQHNFTLL